MSLDTFMVEYERQLGLAIVKYPERYAWSPSLLPTVVGRMRLAIERGTFNHDGFAFRWTCKALGIPYTRKAIVAYVGGQLLS